MGYSYIPPAGSAAWAAISDKPTTFAPAAHNQDWTTIQNPPATYAPIVATTGDIDTGTEAAKAITPAAFVASHHDIRWLTWRCVAAGTSLTASTSVPLDSMPSPVSGTIVAAYVEVDTEGTTGTATYDVHLDGTTIATSTKISVVSGAKTSRSATQPVLTTTAITAGQILSFFADTIQSGTAAKGATFTIGIREG